MNETTILQRIRLAIGRIPSVKVFRNNCGQAWMGKVIRRTADTLTIQDPRPVQFGLHPGSGDLIGWQTLEIMPEHVGRKIAVFTSVEVKTPTGVASADQINWQRVVLDAGGKAVLVKSEEQATAMLK
jgi:hypothetical protein